MNALPGPLHTTPDEVQQLAETLERAGRFAVDLEFVSESRYIPELCLVQVAWTAGDEDRVAAVDPLATDPLPVLRLVGEEGVEKILHAARSDLSLLADRFGLRGRSIFDTQIAAAFLGLGEQVGLARLVCDLLEEDVDKTEQFTDWKRRPLAETQLRYALFDALHLVPLWRELEERLEGRGRVEWVQEESDKTAAEVAERPTPEESYRKVRGWNGLPTPARGALRALAAWREREALSSNRPPSWILQDRVMLQLARRSPRNMDGLRGVRGLNERTLNQAGEQILRALSEGRKQPPPGSERRDAAPEWTAASAGVLAGLVQERCREQQIAPRFVAARAEIDTLVFWWATGDRSEEPALDLLQGWRRELVGQEALDWLAGHTSVAHRPEGGLRLVADGQ